MNATNPIEIDGKVFDRYSLNLIVSGSYDAQGNPDASVVCNLVPTRIAGCRSDEIEARLGYTYGDVAVHRNDLILLTD